MSGPNCPPQLTCDGGQTRHPAGETPASSVGGYRLLRRVGVGAMSEVYLGYDARRLRPVAVKLLTDELAGYPAFISRFTREARMSRVISHPHIVRGLASGYDEDAGKHFLVLEYVDGPNALALLTRPGPLPVGAVVRVGVEVGQALQYLHELHFIHRDVKPENILVGPAGAAKLGDLGVAKRLTDGSDLTTVNEAIGTPDYMPLEQSTSADLVDGRSDLFALGATLYHLLTGRVPFPGDTPAEVARRKADDTPPSASRLRPDTPPALAAVVARALARDPRRRYQTAGEFVAALADTGLVSADHVVAPECGETPSPATPAGGRTQVGTCPAPSPPHRSRRVP